MARRSRNNVSVTASPGLRIDIRRWTARRRSPCGPRPRHYEPILTCPGRAHRPRGQSPRCRREAGRRAERRPRRRGGVGGVTSRRLLDETDDSQAASLHHAQGHEAVHIAEPPTTGGRFGTHCWVMRDAGAHESLGRAAIDEGGRIRSGRGHGPGRPPSGECPLPAKRPLRACNPQPVSTSRVSRCSPAVPTPVRSTVCSTACRARWSRPRGLTVTDVRTWDTADLKRYLYSFPAGQLQLNS